MLHYLSSAKDWFTSVAHRRPTAVVTVALLTGLVLMPAAGALVFKNASDGIADAAFDELKGNSSGDVVDQITDKVVERVLGDLDPKAMTEDFIAQLASDVNGDIDLASSLERIEGQVSKEVMSKLAGVDVDAMLAQAGDRVEAAVMAELAKLDVNQMAGQAIAQAVAQIDVEKLVDDLAKSVDIEAMVQKKLDSVNLTSLLLGSLTGGLRR